MPRSRRIATPSPAPAGCADLYGYRGPGGTTYTDIRQVCKTVGGLGVCVSPTASFQVDVPAALSAIGLNGLLEYVTPKSPDPGTWTTDVVDVR